MLYSFFFFNDTATTEIYTLSLHDALPILERALALAPKRITLHVANRPIREIIAELTNQTGYKFAGLENQGGESDKQVRSEEHTSELQSHLNLVCRLLLQKKNNQQIKANSK